MKCYIQQLNYDEAIQISKWVYEQPYSIYSMDESDNCIEELMNGFYYSVTDEHNTLLGYYCLGESAQVPIGNQFGAYNNKNFIDIGLGIEPNLCGKGLGFDFLNSGLESFKNQLSKTSFRLTVASFNNRAIKIYERIGFEKVTSFKRISETGEMDFQVMVLH